MFFGVLLFLLPCLVHGFWDHGTTTEAFIRTDTTPRQSFFRWQMTHSTWMWLFFQHWDWDGIAKKKRLFVIAGLSIDHIPLTTGVLLNRRVVLTAANPLEPYQHRQRDLRIWALGRTGMHVTPYRYRVWRARRVLPRSDNPEHAHGPRGVHVPRHDVSVVHSFDQIYIYYTEPNRYQYAYRSSLIGKMERLKEPLWFAGSGYEFPEHIKENYKIFYTETSKSDIVNCEKYLPKYWGKFVCIKNTHGLSGVQNGGGLFSDKKLVGLGCFEIRYNEQRILVFTDLRYYFDRINMFANITRGEYYEYAYPEWSVSLGWIYDGGGNYPYIPLWQIQDDMFPLGK